MKVKFEYFAQVRKAAGVESETLELGEATELAAALAQVAGQRGEDFRAIVLDEAGAVRPSLLVVVNGQPATRGQARELADGDSVSLLSAVAGG